MTGEPETATAVIVGKMKLEILAFSTHPDYGAVYKGFTSIGEDDTSVVRNLKTTLRQNHPKLTLVNLPSTDAACHSGNWIQYVSAIHTADSLESFYLSRQCIPPEQVFSGIRQLSSDEQCSIPVGGMSFFPC
jgi:hypothetical protein